jgi:uncharacterized radical SAM superfamily Fe-S cluster-containing enzyme
MTEGAMDEQERQRRTRITLASLMKLVKDGVLVRNTAHDGDPAAYMKMSIELVSVLKAAQEILG